MKVHWQLICVFGHRWSFFRDENAELAQAEMVCPSGHEAVQVSKAYPVDEVVISFVPAGVILDKVTDQRSSHSRWHLLICERFGGTDELKSVNSYTWPEIVDVASKFMGMSKQKAWEQWKRLEL